MCERAGPSERTYIREVLARFAREFSSRARSLHGIGAQILVSTTIHIDGQGGVIVTRRLVTAGCGTFGVVRRAVLTAGEVECEFNTRVAEYCTAVCTRLLRAVDANRNELLVPAWEAETLTSKR